MRHFSFLQSHTTQACNHIPNNQVGFQPHRKSQVSFLQPHMIPNCNHSRKLVAITHWFSFLFLFCSHRNKPADFAMRHFNFLQSHTTQTCYHIPNNEVTFQPHRQSQISFLQPQIIPGCNHSRKLVEITHWFSFLCFLQSQK
jgi:hypothetical protein